MDRLMQFIAGGWVVAAIGTLIMNTGVEEGEQGGMNEWVITLVIVAVVAAVLYLILKRVATSPTTALVLSIIALVTVLGFWLGVTPVFAAAAVALALPPGASEGEGVPASRSGLATAALVVSALALVAWVVLAFTG